MGNFSRDTFDRLKHYVGVRLQQGVPIVDADWNELEDIRRYELQAFLKWFVGSGVPFGNNGFKIQAVAEPNNFIIGGGDRTPEGTGRILVEGLDVLNENDIRYTAQPLFNNTDLASKWRVEPILSLTTPQGNRTDTVYLDVWDREVDSTEDSDLVNPAIGVETCVRIKREWAVRIVEGSAAVPPRSPDGHTFYGLARLERVGGKEMIPASGIRDLRQPLLSLNSVLRVDANGNVGIGSPQPSAKLSIQTPDRYSGSTFRVEAKEEPGKYYLNLDAGTERDIVKWVFNQRNADTNFPNVLAFDRGNVGIGTAGPLARLSVNGNSSQDGTAVFTPDSAKGTQSSHIHRDATGDWYIRSASTAGKVVIQDGGGNVGIGAPQPSAKLSIQTPDRYSGSTFRVEAKEEPGKYYLNLKAVRTMIDPLNPDVITNVSWVFDQTDANTNFPNVLAFDRGNVGIGTSKPKANLVVGTEFGASISGGTGGCAVFGTNLATNFNGLVLFTPYSHDQGYGYAGIKASWGVLTFYASKPDTTVEGQPVTPEPRLHIGHNGYVGIGTINPEEKLHVVGNIKCTGQLEQSDGRDKENVTALGEALRYVTQLRGVFFDWKQREMNDQGKRNLGFIAQEVEKVLPEIVVRSNTGGYSIKYSSLLPVVVEAIKEQQKEIEQIKTVLSQTV